MICLQNFKSIRELSVKSFSKKIKTLMMKQIFLCGIKCSVFFLLLQVVSFIILNYMFTCLCLYVLCLVMYVSSECERLQPRRPRQFFGVGLMIFSQPLTGKASFVYLFTFSRPCSFFLFIFQCFPNKNK